MTAWTEVEDRLTALAADGGFSGSVLVARDGSLLLQFTAGLADRAAGLPIRPGTRFGLASLSKMFTAAAVLTCVRDGLVAPQDRVVDLLPRERRPRTLPDAVTVHHLLTHTSGIGDYAEEDEGVPGYVADYAALWRDLPSYRMERPDDFLPLYDRAPPLFSPGTRWHYCNAGYVLLGAVVEQLTGLPFVDAVTARVLEPAQMTGAGYLRLDEPHPDVAVGYRRDSSRDPWHSNIYSIPVVGGGDGGALATPTDIDRFLRALVSGALLGEDLTAQALTRHCGTDTDGEWFGYGVYLCEDWVGHDGGDPGVDTWSEYWFAHGTSVVLLCNQEHGLHPALRLVRSGLAR